MGLPNLPPPHLLGVAPDCRAKKTIVKSLQRALSGSGPEALHPPHVEKLSLHNWSGHVWRQRRGTCGGKGRARLGGKIEACVGEGHV